MPHRFYRQHKPVAVKSHLPGEPGMWIFVIGELTIFALLFGLFLSAKANNLADFTAAQAHLHGPFGLLNTLLLLTSSWLVALALRSFRQDLFKRTVILVRLSILCAFVFILIKSFEYYSYLKFGLVIFNSQMYMYYFSMTGIHLIHVVIAITLMTTYIMRSHNKDNNNNDKLFFECCCVYWHMMDIIWLILFSVFYVL